MNTLSDEQLLGQLRTQETGKVLLDLFLSRASMELKKKRTAAAVDGKTMGMPHLSLEDWDTAAWYVDIHEDPQILVPELWGGDTIQVPFDALTGKMSPEVYAQQLWQEYLDKQDERKQAKIQRERDELRRLINEHMKDAREILDEQHHS